MRAREWPDRDFWLAMMVAMAGLAVRGYFYLQQGGQIHPDEVFQYLEPAQWKLHGHAYLAWEFEKGARNYAVSGFYSLFVRIGELLDLGRLEIQRSLWALDALASLLLIPACWRAGELIAPTRRHVAWILATLAAMYPVFGYYSVHTLSELHALILVAWGHTTWLALRQEEQRSRRTWLAIATGFLLGLAVVARYATLVLVVVPALDILSAPRSRRAVSFGLAALAPFLFIGVVDYIEWGQFFGSFFEYVRVNVGEGYAQRHGVEPWWFYLSELWSLFGWLVIPLGVGVLVTCVRRPVLAAAALVPLAGYSLFAHKEVRFILPLVPLLFMGAVIGLDELAAVAERGAARQVRQRWLAAACATLLCGVLWQAFSTVATWSRGEERGYFVIQDFVGRQQDASGLIINTTRYYTGGYTLLKRNIPLAFYGRDLLEHRLFNYVAVHQEGPLHDVISRGDFKLVDEVEGVFLFRRR